jgi:hypothetical protein
MNTQVQNTAPLAVAEVLTDGQTTTQLDLTKEALILLFVPGNKPRLEDFQKLIIQLDPNYDTSGKTIPQLKSGILGILNETSVFSSLNRQMIRNITPLNLNRCETTKNKEEFENIKTAVNNFFSSDEPSVNPLNNDNVGNIPQMINETMKVVTDKMQNVNINALGKLVNTYPDSFKNMVGLGKETLISDNKQLKKICGNNKNFWFAIIQYFLHLAATSTLESAIPVNALKAITENDTNIDQTDRDELFNSVKTETKLDTRQFLAVERFSNPKVNELDRGTFLFHGVGTGKTITSLAMALTYLNRGEKSSQMVTEVQANPVVGNQTQANPVVGTQIQGNTEGDEVQAVVGNPQEIEAAIGTQENPLKILIIGPSGLFLSAFKNDTAVLNIYTYNSQINTINPPHNKDKDILIESFQGQVKIAQDATGYINFIGLDYTNLIKNNGFEGIEEILGAHVVIFDEAHKLITESFGPMEYFDQNNHETTIDNAIEALQNIESNMQVTNPREDANITETNNPQNEADRKKKLQDFITKAKNIDTEKQFYFERNDFYYKQIFEGNREGGLTQFESSRNLEHLNVEINVEGKKLNVLEFMKSGDENESNISKISRNITDSYINRTKFVLPNKDPSKNPINIISDHRFFEFCCMKYKTFDNKVGYPPKKIIFLTGTPIQNKTSNLTDITYFLNNPLLNKSNFVRYHDMLSYFNYGDHCFIPWENGEYTADKIGGKLGEGESSFIERASNVVNNLNPLNGIRWFRTIEPYLRAPGAYTGLRMVIKQNLFSIIGGTARVLQLDKLASSIYESGAVGLGLGLAGGGMVASMVGRVYYTNDNAASGNTGGQGHGQRLGPGPVQGTTVLTVDPNDTIQAVKKAIERDRDANKLRVVQGNNNKKPEYANNASGRMYKLLDTVEKTPSKDIGELYNNYVITDFSKLTILEKLTVVEEIVKHIIEKSIKDFTFENNEEITKNYYNGCLNMILVPMIFYRNPQEYTKNIVDKYINRHINNILAGTNIKKENWEAHNDYILGNLTATVFYCRYTIENNKRLVENSTKAYNKENDAHVRRERVARFTKKGGDGPGDGHGDGDGPGDGHGDGDGDGDGPGDGHGDGDGSDPGDDDADADAIIAFRNVSEAEAKNAAAEKKAEEEKKALQTEIDRQNNENEIIGKIYTVIETLIAVGVGTSLTFGVGILEPLILLLSKILSMGPQVVQKIVEFFIKFVTYFIQNYTNAISTAGDASNISILQKILKGLSMFSDPGKFSMAVLGGFLIVVFPIIIDVCSNGKYTNMHDTAKISIVFTNYLVDYIGKDYMKIINYAKELGTEYGKNNMYATAINSVIQALDISAHIVDNVLKPVTYIYVVLGSFLNLTVFSSNIINPYNIKLSLMPYVSIYNYDYQKYAIDDIEAQENDQKEYRWDRVNTKGNKNRFPRKYIEEILCVPTEEQMQKLIELDNVKTRTQTEEGESDPQARVVEEAAKELLIEKKILDYDNIYCNTYEYLNDNNVIELLTNLSNKNIENNNNSDSGLKLKERLGNEKKPLAQEQDELLEDDDNEKLYIFPTTYDNKKYGIYNIPNNFQYKISPVRGGWRNWPQDLKPLFKKVFTNIRNLVDELQGSVTENDEKLKRFEHVYTLMKINRCGAVFVNNNLTIQPHFINEINETTENQSSGGAGGFFGNIGNFFTGNNPDNRETSTTTESTDGPRPPESQNMVSGSTGETRESVVIDSLTADLEKDGDTMKKWEERKEEVKKIVGAKPNFRYYLPVFYPTTIEIMCAFCTFLDKKEENYILMSSTLKPVDMDLQQSIGASLTFPISHEKTTGENGKNNPICIIISPEHKEGFSFTYSPCIYLPGLPNSTGDEEQIYGRILRKYKKSNNTCRTENDVCKYDKQIYQYFAGNSFDKNNLDQFSTIYGTHSKRHIYTTQDNLMIRLKDKFEDTEPLQKTLNQLSNTNDLDDTWKMQELIYKYLWRPTKSSVQAYDPQTRDLKTYLPKSLWDKWYNINLIPREVENTALVNTDNDDVISDSEKYGIYRFISDENKLSQIKQVRDIQDNIFELLSEVENETYEKETILPFDCNIKVVYGLDEKAIFNQSIYNENKTKIQYEQCEMTNENKLYINCVPRKKKETQNKIKANYSRTGGGDNMKKSRKRRNAKLKKTQKVRKKQTIQLRKKYKLLKKGHRTIKRK